MKKMLCFLFFSIISINGFTQEIEKLPAQLWEEIIEISHNKDVPFAKWNKDIYIGLDGNYTNKDSLEVLRVVQKLDSLTETVRVKMTSFKKSNFKIRFLENVKSYPAPRINEKAKSFLNVVLKVNLHSGSVGIKRNIEKSILRKVIHGRFENDKYSFRKRKKSVYESSPTIYFDVTDDFLKLCKEDVEIIHEVYSKGFEARFEKAKKEFAYVLDEIKDKKIKARDKSIWWVKHKEAVVLLPLLVFVLFSIFVCNKANHFFKKKIDNTLIHFTVVVFIANVLIYFGVVLYYKFDRFLNLPEKYRQSPLWDIEVAFTLIACFPFLFLFRFLEFKIRKSNQNIYAKTALIFLSTGSVPFLCLIIIFSLSSFFQDQVISVNKFMGGAAGFFFYLMIIASGRALISFFMFKEHKLIIDNEIQILHLRELKSQAELKSLQSQINPHFLYNSLNSIASLAPVDAVKTQKMAHSLSDLFKYSINRKGKKTSRIQEEIDMVNSYLEIEKIRFGERLQFNIEVEEAVLDCEIPLFLIQPLVENAIKHGISKNKDQGEVTLKIEEKNDELIIEVYDNGPDFPEGLVSGHGLQTVYDLLRLSYQNRATLNWTNQPQKKIQIILPKNS